MKLHTPHTDPDWTLANPERANFWQRLARRTNGLVTLPNLLSVTGLALVLWGVWQIAFDDQWVSGVSFVALGRFLDILDGHVAELTKTKSQLGGTIDVVCDKAAMAAMLFGVLYAHLAWLWFVLALVFYNVYLIYFGLVWARTYGIFPNVFAKFAAVSEWLAIFLLVLQSEESDAWLTTGAGIVIGVWAVLGALAIRSYHRALRRAMHEPQESVDWAQTVTDLVCVVNPRATHYHQAHKTLVSLSRELQKTPLEIDIAEHERKLKKLLSAQVPGKTVLITIAGGDGTVNTVINTIVRLQDHYKAGACILLPLWGGNANDFAYMLNGLRFLGRPKRLIGNGHLVAVPLIKLVLAEPNKPELLRYASCYASFGATAYAARQLEAHRFSTRKISQWFPLVLIGREIVAVVRALVSTPQYTGEIDQKEQTFYDHSLINGSRIAKINRVPVSLAQPYFLHATITHKDPSVIVSLLRIAFGRPAAEYSVQNKLSFKLVTSVDAQIDGEVMHLPAGTRITASSVETNLRYVSSKLT